MRPIVIVAALLALPFVPRDAAAACSRGIQISDTCDGVGTTGCCSGPRRVWCEGGVACAETCGLTVGYPFCGLGGTQVACGVPDLSGTAPQCCLPCGKVSDTPCCDGSVVMGCKAGCLVVLDCAVSTEPAAKICGWDATKGYYNCGGSGTDPMGTSPTCACSCDGKECGEDGCGAVCGVCPAGMSCKAGTCSTGCTPNCAGRKCGGDGCTGSCGICPVGQLCSASGTCECQPDCTNKVCGSDGCDGTCGPGCPDGRVCSGSQCIAAPPVCQPDCSGGRKCGPDGCNGSCGTCQPPTKCGGDGKCHDPKFCLDSCFGKACGPDACGGTCGDCADGLQCAAGLCVAPIADAAGDAAETPADGQDIAIADVPADADATQDPARDPATDPGADVIRCPPGTYLADATCRSLDAPSAGSGGCGAEPAPGIPALCALLLALAVLRRGRGTSRN